MEEFNQYVPNHIFVEIPKDSDARNLKYPKNYFDFAIT